MPHCRIAVIRSMCSSLRGGVGKGVGGDDDGKGAAIKTEDSADLLAQVTGLPASLHGGVIAPAPAPAPQAKHDVAWRRGRKRPKDKEAPKER